MAVAKKKRCEDRLKILLEKLVLEITCLVSSTIVPSFVDTRFFFLMLVSLKEPKLSFHYPALLNPSTVKQWVR